MGGSDSPVEVLLRWELFGARWRVLSRTETRLEIALLTCSGGEIVDHLDSTDPRLLAYVGTRASSDED